MPAKTPELVDKRFILAVVGGGSDTPQTFEKYLKPPLVNEYGLYTVVEFIPGRWHNRYENAPHKIKRVHDKLGEIVDKHGRIDGLIGICNGSPLAVAATTQDKLSERVGKFGLISGVLRRPDKLTPWMRLATQVYPALHAVVEEAIDTGLTTLAPRMKQGDVLSIRGARDGIVRPYLSIVPGARNEEYPTQPQVRFSTHSDNVRGALGWPPFHNHIRGIYASS